VTSKPDFKVMVLLLVFMQLTRDLFAIAKFLLLLVLTKTVGVLVIVMAHVGLLQLYTFALPWLKSVLPYAGKYLFPTAIVAETGTVYLTVLVTINRYLAVCRPYDPPGRRSVEAARLHVLAVAVFSVIYNVPRFFEFDVVQRQVRGHVMLNACWRTLINYLII